jgi:phosphonate transport system substrate-binding protein
MARIVRRANSSAVVAPIVASATAAAAEECENRGQLDTLYRDEDNDLVTDVPTDPLSG